VDSKVLPQVGFGTLVATTCIEKKGESETSNTKSRQGRRNSRGEVNGHTGMGDREGNNPRLA